MSIRQIVAGLLCDAEGRFLIGQRARHKSHGLQWEFPGGKVERGEGEEQALARELREELDIAAEIGPLAARVRHRYNGGPTLEIAFYWVVAYSGKIANRVFEAIAWAPPGEMATYDFLAADRSLIEQLARGELQWPIP